MTRFDLLEAARYALEILGRIIVTVVVVAVVLLAMRTLRTGRRP